MRVLVMLATETTLGGRDTIWEFKHHPRGNRSVLINLTEALKRTDKRGW